MNKYQAKKKYKFPLVEVQWIDSSSASGWQEEIQRHALTCWSAGYLLHRDRKTTVVALSCSSAESANGHGDAITIPTVCVQRVRRLK